MGIAWIPDPVAVRMLLAEMNTNVEDDPRGAQPLRIEQAHVVAGIVILLLVAIRPQPAAVQAGAQFWHMVDLVWVLLFPIIYLLQ